MVAYVRTVSDITSIGIRFLPILLQALVGFNNDWHDLQLRNRPPATNNDTIDDMVNTRIAYPCSTNHEALSVYYSLANAN